jgi:hypothetical protein
MAFAHGGTVVLDGPEEGRPIALAAVGCES